LQQCCIKNVVALITNDIQMKPQEVLHQHRLKRTSCREGIINAIIESGHALSENEIRDKLEGNYDRTTFYRSFKTLEENQILHKIVVDNQMVKYAIDRMQSRNEAHAHFYCQACECVLCMESVKLPMPELPRGYVPKTIELIIKGLCSKCTVPSN
jgi:Fur family transcriptional regulator, ferric uptake regulator